MTNYKRQAIRQNEQKLLNWFKGQLRIRPLPVWILVAADVLLIGVALVVFALFHHVIPREQQSLGIISERGAAAEQVMAQATNRLTAEARTSSAPTLESAATPAPTPGAPTATPEPVGYFGTKFADMFTSGDVVTTDNSYKSANINISMMTYYEYDSRIYVADIYVKDISCFKTALAKEKFGIGFREYPNDIAARQGSIIAINGDYYGARRDGVVIRNGFLYREEEYPIRDVCVLYWDGTMKTFPKGSFDSIQAIQDGAYQAWNFGPTLLDRETGEALTTFDSQILGKNPRTAIGYYEPGHYCFVAVDGRSSISKGATLAELSELMFKIGCKQAYNLDGGESSYMVKLNSVVNVPASGGRQCSDILMIVEP